MHYIYLHARNNQRFRYNVTLGLFETCYPAKRTLINAICCKQWQEWQTIAAYYPPNNQLIESLKLELLVKQGYL